MKANSLVGVSLFSSALALCASVAAEPAVDWGGFYVDGAIGARSSTANYTESWRFQETDNLQAFSETYTGTQKLDLAQTQFAASLSAGWRYASAPVVVGVGVFADLAGSDAGSGQAVQSYRDSLGAAEDYFVSKALEQKSRYGISLDIGPNWRTHPYAKLTYAWSEYEAKDQTSCGNGFGPSTVKKTETLSGVGVGGGVRHLQSDNLYFFAEVMWQDLGSADFTGTPLCSVGPPTPDVTESYDSSINIETSNLIGLVGVGWRF